MARRKKTQGGAAAAVADVERAPLTERAREAVAIQMLPVAGIWPSATNPRKHFDATALAELEASVRKDGVLQPVLVRPVDDQVGGVTAAGYELVAGERRWRAARAAGLEQVPAIVRDLTDVEVLELQVVENLQRADLHPLEEADGYRRLHEVHGHDVDAIAAKVGKSRGYVYARMKLLALPEAAREHFFEGRLSPSVALLVARIPVPELADQAARVLAGQASKEDRRELELPESYFYGTDDVQPIAMREAAEWIQDIYTLRMDQAPFSLDDAELVPAAGACATCPKRTSNDQVLFEDMKRSADACTDPACFRLKREAHAAQVLEKARAKGRQVLTGKEADKALRYGSSYARLDGQAGEIGQWGKTWKKLLGKAAPAPTVAVDDQGRAVELVPLAELKAVAKDRGLVVASSRASASESDARRKREAKVRNRAIELALEAAPEAAGGLIEGVLLQVVARRLAASLSNDDARLLFRLRHPDHAEKKGSYPRWAEMLAKEVDEIGTPELAALAAQLALVGSVSQWSSGMPPATTAAAKGLGLDLAAFVKQARAELKPKPTKKAPATKKAAAKAKPRARKKAAKAGGVS